MTQSGEDDSLRARAAASGKAPRHTYSLGLEVAALAAQALADRGPVILCKKCSRRHRRRAGCAR